MYVSGDPRSHAPEPLERPRTGRRSASTVSAASASLLSALFLIACGANDAPPTPPRPEVLVVDVVARDVDLYKEWVGSTVGLVDATIRPKVQGYLLSQDYTDGSFVEAGDLLFQIDPRQFKAALDAAVAELGVAKAILEKAEIHVDRYTPLAEKGAVSEQELQDAIQARAAGRARVAAAQANVDQARLNLEWTRIHAPVEGIAGIASVQVGDLVNPVTLLTTISTVDPIKVSLPVSEVEYLKFSRRRDERGAEADAEDELPLELILADGSRYPHPGHVTVTGRAVSQDTGTIIVQALFPNPKRLLRPGQFAKVRAPIDHRKNALLIPQRAVKQTQGRDQVAVVGSDDKVKLVEVTLGPRSGELWIVDEGVQAGQKVIVEGLQKVRPGTVVSPKAAPTSKKPIASGA